MPRESLPLSPFIPEKFDVVHTSSSGQLDADTSYVLASESPTDDSDDLKISIIEHPYRKVLNPTPSTGQQNITRILPKKVPPALAKPPEINPPTRQSPTLTRGLKINNRPLRPVPVLKIELAPARPENAKLGPTPRLSPQNFAPRYSTSPSSETLPPIRPREYGYDDYSIQSQTIKAPPSDSSLKIAAELPSPNLQLDKIFSNKPIQQHSSPNTTPKTKTQHPFGSQLLNRISPLIKNTWVQTALFALGIGIFIDRAYNDTNSSADNLTHLSNLEPKLLTPYSPPTTWEVSPMPPEDIPKNESLDLIKRKLNRPEKIAEFLVREWYNENESLILKNYHSHIRTFLKQKLLDAFYSRNPASLNSYHITISYSQNKPISLRYNRERLHRILGQITYDFLFSVRAKLPPPIEDLSLPTSRSPQKQF